MSHSDIKQTGTASEKCSPFVLFYHTVAACVFADLRDHDKHLVVTKRADLTQTFLHFSARQNDQQHVHRIDGSLTVKNGVTAIVFLEVADDLLRIFAVRDQLQAGCSECDLPLQGRSEKQTRCITDAVKQQKKQIVAER